MMSLATRLAFRWSSMVVAVVWVVSLVVAVILQGCGASAVDAARTGLGLSARAVVELDAEAANGYRAHHERTLAESSTMEEYTRRMRAWDGVVDAARVAKGSLLAAESALDAYAEGRGDEASWFAAASCLALALDRLSDAAEAAGVELPGTLAAAVDSLGGMGRVTCPSPR